jgi:hypothetical protein
MSMILHYPLFFFLPSKVGSSELSGIAVALWRITAALDYSRRVQKKGYHSNSNLQELRFGRT